MSQPESWYFDFLDVLRLRPGNIFGMKVNKNQVLFWPLGKSWSGGKRTVCDLDKEVEKFPQILFH